MRRIGVAVPVYHEAWLHDAAIAEVVLQLTRRKVVYVAALGVGECAKQPLADDLLRQHLSFAVAAVLEHHAVPPGLFARLDDLPRIIHRLRAGNLDKDVLAGAQRIELHFGMENRRRCDVDDIHFRVVANGLPALRRSRIGMERAGAFRLADELAGSLNLHVLNVAQRGDLYARQLGNALDRRQATVAHSYYSDANCLHGRDREVRHRGGFKIGCLSIHCYSVNHDLRRAATASGRRRKVRPSAPTRWRASGGNGGEWPRRRDR